MKIEQCPLTLADDLKRTYSERDSEKIIESYREKSRLLNRSIETRSPILELVRPVFSRVLDEMVKSSPWFEPPYSQTKEYQDMVEDLHNNLIGNRGLNWSLSSNVPIRIPSYIGWVKNEAPWSWLIVAALPLTIIPWIFINIDAKKSREGITKKVLSLDPETKCIQDINYIDDSVRKYFFEQRRLFDR